MMLISKLQNQDANSGLSRFRTCYLLYYLSLKKTPQNSFFLIQFFLISFFLILTFLILTFHL